MVRRSLAALSLALMMVPFFGSAAQASGIKEDVECFFRVYIQEGGEQGLDCFI